MNSTLEDYKLQDMGFRYNPFVHLDAARDPHLFDYLVPRVAKAVLNKLYELLLPGGEMVIGNFHVSNPDRYAMEYWADWFLILRKEKEFINLCDEDLIKEKSIIFDEPGIQMFLHLKKP